MEKKELIVPPEVHHVRLDFFLAKELSDLFSRTKVKQMIDEGHILLNGKAVKAHTKINSGDAIQMTYDVPREESLRAESIPIDIVYEDEDLIVVNKPPGMVVHPGCGNPKGTLVNAVLYHTSLSSVDEKVRPGIVHRLDKDTSGILVIAKNDVTHRMLANQFKLHDVDRRYWVVVSGVVQHEEMRCNDALGRSVMNRKRVIIKPDDGKPSITNFKVLKRFAKATLLEARPETGRTHQIRVHLRSLGYPVVGDLVYGVGSQWIKRQALHAKELGFTHPKTNKKMFFTSNLPADMEHLLTQL